MKLKHLCPYCEAELDENLMRVFANVPCPKCGKRVDKETADIRYFPEDPGNKVFAVDVYVTVCKCVKVEAKDESAAEKAVNAYMDGLSEERLAQEGSRTPRSGRSTSPARPARTEASNTTERRHGNVGRP